MLLILILASAAALAALVYRYDMYEREPWYMLLLAAIGGAGAYQVLSHGEDLVLRAIPRGGSSLFAQAMVAGISEELFKLLIVLAIWFVIPRHFNDPFDGLIYGAMAGLGFALAESTFYVGLMGRDIGVWTAAGQEAVRLLLHLLMGALTCVGLGLARFRVRHWPLMLALGISGSMLMHFCWDYFCGLPSFEREAAFQQRAIAVGLMLTAMTLFGFFVVVAVKHSSRTHAAATWRELWGWPFSVFFRRRGDGGRARGRLSHRNPPDR